MNEEKALEIIIKFFEIGGTGNEPFYVAVKTLLNLYFEAKAKNRKLEERSDRQTQLILKLTKSQNQREE